MSYFAGFTSTYTCSREGRSIRLIGCNEQLDGFGLIFVKVSNFEQTSRDATLYLFSWGMFDRCLGSARQGLPRMA